MKQGMWLCVIEMCVKHDQLKHFEIVSIDSILVQMQLKQCPCLDVLLLAKVCIAVPVGEVIKNMERRFECHHSRDFNWWVMQGGIHKLSSWTLELDGDVCVMIVVLTTLAEFENLSD